LRPGQPVATVRIVMEDGSDFKFPLRVGFETADFDRDEPNIAQEVSTLAQTVANNQGNGGSVGRTHWYRGGAAISAEGSARNVARVEIKWIANDQSGVRIAGLVLS